MFFTELEPTIAELDGTGAHFTRLATLAAPRWPLLPRAEARQEPRKFRRRLIRWVLKVTREVPDSKLLPVPDWGSQAGCVAGATWASFGSSGQFTRNPTLRRQRSPRRSMQRKTGVKFVVCDGCFRKTWAVCQMASLLGAATDLLNFIWDTIHFFLPPICLN